MLTVNHNAKYFCRVLHYSRHCVISNGGLPVKGIMAQVPRNVFHRASGQRQVCVQNRARVWAEQGPCVGSQRGFASHVTVSLFL